MKIVFEAETGRTGVDAFREHTPDVTIVDLKTGRSIRIELIKAIRSGSMIPLPKSWSCQTLRAASIYTGRRRRRNGVPD